MERLTIKQDLGNGMYHTYTEAKKHKIVDKLAEFEDFMEEQGFESLKDLQKYIEQSFKVVKVLSDKNIQINNLQYRWQKLKEWVKEIEKENFTITITPQAILTIIQELEKEIK